LRSIWNEAKPWANSQQQQRGKQIANREMTKKMNLFLYCLSIPLIFAVAAFVLNLMDVEV
jgi:hypothetical protein